MNSPQLQIRDYQRTLRIEIETADGADIDEWDARLAADAFIAGTWPQEYWDLEYSEHDTSSAVTVVYTC